MKAYSAERKEALVRRMMPPENASVSSLARETGIPEKGHALAGRYKQKDAYDIYYCVRNYPGGDRCTGTGMSAAPGACKRRTRLPVHRREVRHLRGIRAYLREMQRHTTARCDEIAKRALILYSDDIFPALITWRR